MCEAGEGQLTSWRWNRGRITARLGRRRQSLLIVDRIKPQAFTAGACIYSGRPLIVHYVLCMASDERESHIYTVVETVP